LGVRVCPDGLALARNVVWVLLIPGEVGVPIGFASHEKADPLKAAVKVAGGERLARRIKKAVV